MKKSFTLKQLAALTNSSLQGDEQLIICGVADLQGAGPQDISFLAENEFLPIRFESALAETKAAAVILSSASHKSNVTNFLINSDPSRAFQTIAEAFHPWQERISAFTGIHPSAVIHESAQIDAGVSIGPLVVIDKDVTIGAGTVIGPNCSISVGVTIGKECHFYSHVSVREFCHIADRVILQPGAVIGSCGFGYTTDSKGVHKKLSQLGNVVIEEDVEIGANTTIDRARIGSTKIGKGTKIDNGVQIAHGVKIGSHCLFAAHTAIAGCVEIDHHVVMGGQVGVTGHIKIGPYTMFAAQTGISKSILKPGKYAGKHVRPLNEHNRNEVLAHNLEKTIKKMIKKEKLLPHE